MCYYETLRTLATGCVAKGKICELLSAGDKTIWRTIAKIDSMTRAVLAESTSTVNLRKYQ